MPRRAVVTETVNGNTGVGVHAKATTDNVESPPGSPSRQTSSTSGKGTSLRRSLSKTLSSLFRSSSSASATSPPSSPPAKQPVSPGPGSPQDQTARPRLSSGDKPPKQNQGFSSPQPRQERQSNSQPTQQQPQDDSLQQQPQGYSPQQQPRQQPQGYSPQQQPHGYPQRQSRKQSQDSSPQQFRKQSQGYSPVLRRDSPETPPFREASATLPRLYQKRQSQQQQQPVAQSTLAPALRRQQAQNENTNRSASCTRISDLPPGDDFDGCPARSVANVTDLTPEPDVNPRRRWHSTLNTAQNRRSSSNKRMDTSRLRFSSTFIRKSVGDDLGSPLTPLSPAEDSAFFAADQVDADGPMHNITRHKSKGRGMRRLPSKVERKEAYTRENRPPSVSISGSCGTLTRLSRKAPTAVMTDL